MVNKRRLRALIRKLIRKRSENPPGNEREIALWVGGYLKRIGLRVRYYEFAPRRPNVVGMLKGRSPGRGLLLSPHLDTVPAGSGWQSNPFGGIIRRGKVYGRGATDCKGNLASCLEAINSIVEDGITPPVDITLAATADEESGSRFGIIPLVERRILNPKAALILDSDEFGILIAQKGLLHLKVKVFGKRAHGAYPWLGVNAIEKAVEVIHELKRLKLKFHRHPLMRGPTVNIGKIMGGDKVNVVAPYCEFEADLRFLPGMDPYKLLDKIKKVVNFCAKKYKIEIENLQNPYEIDKETPLVRGLIRVVKRHGRKPLIKGSEGATVITFFKKRGIPAIGFGFGTRGQAHATNEHARIGDLYDGALILADFIAGWAPDEEKV